MMMVKGPFCDPIMLLYFYDIVQYIYKTSFSKFSVDSHVVFASYARFRPTVLHLMHRPCLYLLCRHVGLRKSTIRRLFRKANEFTSNIFMILYTNVMYLKASTGAIPPPPNGRGVG